MNNNQVSLSIFTGRPRFSKPLHVGSPNIGSTDSFIAMTRRILERRWLTNNGPIVQEFEKKITRYLGVKHCVVVNNATIGIQILAKALNWRGQVIVPSFTFVATPHALSWLGLEPVFCDVDKLTQNLDPLAVKRAITDKTCAILGVHLWGRPCAVPQLTAIAEDQGINLCYDAAHAFGCSFGGKMIGNFGSAEVFSFHATKFFNTFEGGAITTNCDDLYENLTKIRNFGFLGYDNVVSEGTNGKMTEISAAMGLVNLEDLESTIMVNKRNYYAYKAIFDSMSGFEIVQYNESEKCNYQYIVVVVDNDICPISRDGIVRVLHAENVLARRYFYPGCHRMIPYAQQYRRINPLDVTENIGERTIVFPTGSAVGVDEIIEIGNILHCMIEHASVVRSALDESFALSHEHAK